MIVNNINPKPLVSNSKDPNYKILHIDFTRYPNWLNSHKNKNFTNYYKNDKHVAKTYHSLFSKVLPFAQENISTIMTARQRHCHLIDGDAYGFAKESIEKIHGITLGKSIEIWQIGVTGGTRLIGPILSNENTFTLYPANFIIKLEK